MQERLPSLQLIKERRNTPVQKVIKLTIGALGTT